MSILSIAMLLFCAIAIFISAIKGLKRNNNAYLDDAIRWSAISVMWLINVVINVI